MSFPGGNTLPKSERLAGGKCIDALLADGRWGVCGCIKYCWLPREDASMPSRIMVSVPKRFFKRAVKRNLLKRRIREAYRVRKIAGADILLQYNSPEVAGFDMICADVEAVLGRIEA